MSEPEVAAVETPTDAPVEAPAEAAVEAPEEKAEPYSPAQQKIFDGAMARQSKARREDGERFSTQAQADATRIAELQAQVPQVVEPAILAVPDQLDDDFDTKQAEYVESIRVNAEFKANQAAVARQEQSQIAADNQAAVDNYNAQVVTFSENAEKLNIPSADLVNSINVVNVAQLDPQLSLHMLSLPQGPSVYKYLADPANASELDSLRMMTPMAAAAHIADKIIPAAISAAPKVDPPMDPAEPLGGGVLPGKERGPKGVIYE